MNTETREKPLGDQEPKPPFPKQHQKGPGIEAKLDPRPRYQAEAYKAAGKLENKVALVTGGNLAPDLRAELAAPGGGL